MKNLICFGFFRETVPQLRHKLASIKTAEFLDSPHPLKYLILRYLEEGKEWGLSSGHEIYDPFTTPPTDQTFVSIKKTDGTWIWPDLITYFVDKYDFAVPDEFMQKMRMHGFRVPEVTLEAPDDSQFLPENCNVVQNTTPEDVEDLQRAEAFQDRFPEIADELSELFAECATFEQFCETCSANIGKIVELLELDSLGDYARYCVSSLLENSPIPPKYVGLNGAVATQEEIEESRTKSFLFWMPTVDKFPMSWSEEKVVWLERHETEWCMNIETWKESAARYYREMRL
ncbi:hypothetical protein [Gimesia sp.]|uniref:hypothetical protein n=1 Tax=Gimesia sp. TaxID=2024833 RepID=UPI003A8F2C28